MRPRPRCALYLNVFVGVVQAFQKVSFLQPLAPTQSEPPFAIAQGLVLVIFLALTVLASKRLRAGSVNTERNPQAQQMGDESMARNLAFQAQAIWPQEEPLFARYRLSGPLRILDLGCGTGEITRRLADLYPQAQVVGVDILESNLALARRDSDATATACATKPAMRSR